MASPRVMGSPPSEMLEKVVQVGWEGVSVEDEGRLVFVLVFKCRVVVCFSEDTVFVSENARRSFAIGGIAEAVSLVGEELCICV